MDFNIRFNKSLRMRIKIRISVPHLKYTVEFTYYKVGEITNGGGKKFTFWIDNN